MCLPILDFSADERAALRDSFLRLLPRSDEVAKSLYAHLFERLPEAQALFRVPMEEQRDKLIQMLALMIDALDQPEAFGDACRASGERHRRYGTQAEHYGPLGESLLEALREVGVPPPTPAEEALWLRLYTGIAGLMNEKF